MAACQQCGVRNPDGFRFCGACGAPLADDAAPRESRKTVTALFCDVVGSTVLGELLDAETLRTVMGRYFGEIDSIVRRHGGRTEKFIGDAVMAVFGLPRVQEDDALRAVRAAAEIRDCLPALAEQFGVALTFRTGVNTGQVVVGAGQTLATGDAINVAARLQQAAAPGDIVIGAATRDLVRDAAHVDRLEPLALKGKSDPVAAFRLLDVDFTATGSLGRRTRRSWAADVSSSACATPSSRRSTSGCACFSRCWVRPASASRDWSRSSSKSLPARRRSSAAAACTTAMASRSGRSSRPSVSSAHGPPACSSNSPASVPPWRASCSGRCGGCSSAWPANGRWWRCSTTSSGVSRRCSTSWTTSPTCHARRRSCSCAWRARICWTSGRGGRGAS